MAINGYHTSKSRIISGKLKAKKLQLNRAVAKHDAIRVTQLRIEIKTLEQELVFELTSQSHRPINKRYQGSKMFRRMMDDLSRQGLSQ